MARAGEFPFVFVFCSPAVLLGALIAFSAFAEFSLLCFVIYFRVAGFGS